MCGIVGYVGDVDNNKIDRMLHAIAHRGPDDSGIYINDNVGLGNNRLAVIDLSKKGHQPMFDDKKEICLVYNGEIYNFKEVRDKLQKEFKFKSGSDTEVIIYAYKKWGVSCLKHLNGMFAFVIYDIKNNLLFGARDRLGEKPLKYYFDGQKFIFASEIKAILSVLDEKPQMDLGAINDFLTLSFVPAPKTGFKYIYKLPPASYFIYKNQKIRVYKYWDLNFQNKLSLTENEWINELENMINKSVKDRMISDVPVGSFLSGGIDSSAVTSFMARNSFKKISTFNIGFKNSEFDESEYAKIIAKLYNTNHFTLMVDSKMCLDELEKIANHYDEPFADNSIIPTILLSRFTHKKVTVVLSGDGGDENFAGYDRYNIVKFADLYRTVPKWIRNGSVNLFSKSLFHLYPNQITQKIKTFSDTFDKPFYYKYLHYKSFLTNSDKNNIFTKNNLKDTFSINKNDYNPKLSELDNALNIDRRSYLPEDLLYKTDIASMSAGLEVRSPLLDYQLMEYVAQMPDNFKIKNYNKKYIFKKMLLTKNILPKEIINRPKQGFVLPINKWFKTDLKDYLVSQLESKKFREVSMFDNKKLDDYINNYFETNLNYYNNMFALLSLSNWINKYF